MNGREATSPRKAEQKRAASAGDIFNQDVAADAALFRGVEGE